MPILSLDIALRGAKIEIVREGEGNGNENDKVK